MKHKHPLKAEPDATPAVFASAITALFAFIVLWTLLHSVTPPIGWTTGRDAPIVINVKEIGTILRSSWLSAPDPRFLVPALKFVGHVFTRPFEFLIGWDVLIPCLIYLTTALICARICGGIVYRAIYRGLPPVSGVTTSIGQEPLYAGLGAQHINEAWLDRRMAVGDGVRLAPGVIMPLDVETEHLAVMGTTGSGKSTIIEGLLRQAIRRGDRALIVDVKGNARKRFGAAAAGELSIGGDGLIWALGRDIRTREDAIELASILIPASKDPIWSDGARLYLVGLIVALQRQLGARWGWRDLKAALAKSFQEQERLIRESMPDIVQLLQCKDGDPTATVMSILVTIVANVGSIVWTLAEREQAGGERISLRQWAAGKCATRVIFLRLEFDRESQSSAFLKLALRCVQATLLGGAVQDGIDHAIWLGLDELPRFCDDTTVERLVALGRSRGLRICRASGAGANAPVAQRRRDGVASREFRHSDHFPRRARPVTWRNRARLVWQPHRHLEPGADGWRRGPGMADQGHPGARRRGAYGAPRKILLRNGPALYTRRRHRI